MLHPTRRTVVLVSGAALLAPVAALGQAFPARTMRIIVPYPPGGPTDALARLLAAELTSDLAVAVIVENRPGASGAVGTREVARSEPDGHTLVLGTNQTHVTNAVLLKEPGYDATGDFVAVAGLAGLQHALVTPKSGAGTVAELLARAKAQPGKLNYGSTGSGSASHLAMELLIARTGARMTHVPFRGAGPMSLEIVAGRIDCAFATLPSVLGQIESGAVNALALASSQPAPQLPRLPLLSREGVSGAEADAWLALFAPRATPAAILARLSSVTVAAMRRPQTTAAAVKLGMVPDVRDSSAFATYLDTERTKWLDVIRLAGVKAD